MTKVLNCGYFMAEQAIKDFFAQTEEAKREEDELLEYCRVNYPPIFSQRVAFRLQRRHINHIVVNSALVDLPQHRREVLVRKYRKREMITKIAMELNMSVSRVLSIERAAQDNISHMLLYMLTVRDVYSRVKVVNMIHILDLRLSFLEEHPEILPDVNRDWVLSLKICREKYRLLYSAMEGVMQQSDSSLHCNIIAERLRNPSLSSKELSAICHVSQNGVNRHLRTYEEDMSKYLVA